MLFLVVDIALLSVVRLVVGIVLLVVVLLVVVGIVLLVVGIVLLVVGIVLLVFVVGIVLLFVVVLLVFVVVGIVLLFVLEIGHKGLILYQLALVPVWILFLLWWFHLEYLSKLKKVPLEKGLMRVVIRMAENSMAQS